MRFYGQFDPPVDKFIYERYFRNFKGSGYFIECGAFDGYVESSCKLFEESFGWTGCNIEASPKNFAALDRNRPNSINLNLGLSSEKGVLTFTDVKHPDLELFGNGSFSHGQEHKKILDDSKCSYSKVDVKTITYGDLFDFIDPEVVNLMVLDVEGHELEVLKGMVGVKHLPQILCIEHGHLGVEAVREKVEPLGYVFDTTSFVNSFYIHSSLYPWIKPALEEATIDEGAEELRFKVSMLSEKLSIAEHNLEKKIKTIDLLMSSYNGVISSKSWKIMAPLRKIKSLFSL